MKITTALLLAALLCAASQATAQAVYTLNSFGGAFASDTYLPSTTHPNGGPGVGNIPLPMTGALVAGTIGGGIAIDQTTRRVFSSDGFVITTDDHNLYAPFSAPGAPAPIAPAPIMLGGGPITGMGCDPAAGILWLTDGLSYGGYALGFPFGVIVPPMPFPFPVLATAGISGIDYDSADGTLWAVDMIGNVYHWFPGGAPIGPQPVASVTSIFGLPFTGIAVNESNGAGSLAPHFCSTQLPGYHIVITDGLQVVDALNPLNPPIFGTSVNGAARGLAYSSDMQYTPGAGLAPVLVGQPGWRKPQNNTVGGLNALRLVGAQPLTTAIFLYDNCPIVGGLFIPASGETLWINPFSFTFGSATFVTDAAGEVNFPIDLTFAPAGYNLVSQWAIYSPLSPMGYAFSDAMRFVVGTP